jgi:hypothetical protein
MKRPNISTGPEPGVSGGVSVSAEVVHGGAEATAGARVGGEDARQDSAEVIAISADPVVVDVERGGAPEVAPPGGEDLRAGAFLGGEVRDDDAEDVVVEAADAVLTAPTRRGKRRLLILRRRLRTLPLCSRRRRPVWVEFRQFPLPRARAGGLHLHRRRPARRG